MDDVTLKIVQSDKYGVFDLCPDDAHKEMIVVGDEAAIITHATSTLQVNHANLLDMFRHPRSSSSSSQ